MLNFYNSLFEQLFWRKVLNYRFKSEPHLEVDLEFFKKDLKINLGGIVLFMFSDSELLVTVTHFNRCKCIYIQGIPFEPNDNCHVVQIKKYPVTLTIDLVQFKVEYLT